RRGRDPLAPDPAAARRAAARGRARGLRARRRDPGRGEAAGARGAGGAPGTEPEEEEGMKRANGSGAPRDIDELVERASPWLSGDGPHAGMVLSTRMRLARNLQSVPFTHRARDEQLQGVMMSVVAAAERAPGFQKGLLLRMNDIGTLE